MLVGPMFNIALKRLEKLLVNTNRAIALPSTTLLMYHLEDVWETN